MNAAACCTLPFTLACPCLVVLVCSLSLANSISLPKLMPAKKPTASSTEHRHSPKNKIPLSDRIVLSFDLDRLRGSRLAMT